MINLYDFVLLNPITNTSVVLGAIDQASPCWKRYCRIDNRSICVRVNRTYFSLSFTHDQNSQVHFWFSLEKVSQLNDHYVYYRFLILNHKIALWRVYARSNSEGIGKQASRLISIFHLLTLQCTSVPLGTRCRCFISGLQERQQDLIRWLRSTDHIVG